jgi:hypothetical protein
LLRSKERRKWERIIKKVQTCSYAYPWVLEIYHAIFCILLSILYTQNFAKRLSIMWNTIIAKMNEQQINK